MRAKQQNNEFSFVANPFLLRKNISRHLLWTRSDNSKRHDRN